LKENYSILQCSLDKSGCNRIDVFICSHVVLLLSSDSLENRLGWSGVTGGRLEYSDDCHANIARIRGVRVGEKLSEMEKCYEW
jgi:hypothetical protein